MVVPKTYALQGHPEYQVQLGHQEFKAHKDFQERVVHLGLQGGRENMALTVHTATQEQEAT